MTDLSFGQERRDGLDCPEGKSQLIGLILSRIPENFLQDGAKVTAGRSGFDLCALCGLLLNIGSGEENLHCAFEAAGVGFVEAGVAGAVEVEHAEQFSAVEQGDDDFGIRRAVAGDVAGEIVHVAHDDALALRGGGAADAFADLDAHAGDLALEGAEHEFVALEQVEAGPVEVGQGLHEEGGRVGEIADPVAFAVEDGGELTVERGVELGLGGGLDGGDGVGHWGKESGPRERDWEECQGSAGEGSDQIPFNPVNPVQSLDRIYGMAWIFPEQNPLNPVNPV